MKIIEQRQFVWGRPSTVSMPQGATIVGCGLIRRIPTIWIECDLAAAPETRCFDMRPAGIGFDPAVWRHVDIIIERESDGNDSVWQVVEYIGEGIPEGALE